MAGEGWVKGSVVSSAAGDVGSEHAVAVRLGSGEEVTVPSAAESGRGRFDHWACGKVEVGRHMQLLFDGGLWYTGLVLAVKTDGAGEQFMPRAFAIVRNP